MKFCLFDVDHTIVTTITVRDFVVRAMRRGVLPWRTMLYVPYFFLLYRVFGVREKHFLRPFRFLRGIRRDALEQLAAELFLTQTRARLNPAVLQRLDQARAAGAGVAIASSSFRFILEPLAEHLGIADLVASEIEFENGLSTGRIMGRPAFRKDKREQVLRFLEERGVTAAECSLYTDSIDDLPLLRCVGQAVVVNPNRRLRKMARRAGWEILDTRASGRRPAPC